MPGKSCPLRSSIDSDYSSTQGANWPHSRFFAHSQADIEDSTVANAITPSALFPFLPYTFPYTFISHLRPIMPHETRTSPNLRPNNARSTPRYNTLRPSSYVRKQAARSSQFLLPRFQSTDFRPLQAPCMSYLHYLNHPTRNLVAC